jgi:hypothetical protein
VKIEYDKAYEFSIKGQASFGTLPEDIVMDVLADGRVASHFLERHLPLWFPELEFVSGCRDHDHISPLTGAKFDQKSFTKLGCKFMPSSMIGVGRKFDRDKFLEKSGQLTYIICDLTQLPSIGVVFKQGVSLAEKYPKGAIPLRERTTLFGDAAEEAVHG